MNFRSKAREDFVWRGRNADGDNLIISLRRNEPFVSFENVEHGYGGSVLIPREALEALTKEGKNG